jgi:hypothetical protein
MAPPGSAGVSVYLADPPRNLKFGVGHVFWALQRFKAGKHQLLQINTSIVRVGNPPMCIFFRERENDYDEHFFLYFLYIL